VVANTDKTVGEDMEQEAAQELGYRDRQGAFLVAMCGVPPAKGDLALVEGDQAMVGNGHAVGVATEILQDMFGTSKGWFAVNHPIVTEEWTQEGGKCFWVSQELQLPMEWQLVAGEGALEGSHELAAKEAAERLDRQEEAIARTNPSRVIEGQSASGNHAMDMG
jgi:hypothetical protein